MYYSTSNATANDSYFTFSMCQGADYYTHPAQAAQHTFSFYDQKLNCFNAGYEEDESNFIRFNFENNTHVDKPIFIFDDFKTAWDEKPLTEVAFANVRERAEKEDRKSVLYGSFNTPNSYLPKQVELVSPRTSSLPLGASDTKSTISRDAD